MTEAQACFGRIQLKKLPKILEIFRNNASFIFKKLPEAISPPKIPSGVMHSFLMLGCKYHKEKSGFNRDIFLERLTKNRMKILENESKSDIKGINFRPGKIIGAGYRTVQYKIPLYKKFSPKNRCLIGEEFVRNSLFIDIHRWRTRSEINEELSIINKTFDELSK